MIAIQRGSERADNVARNASDRNESAARDVLILFAWSLDIVAIWWLATHRIDRFWLPAVSLWAILAGFGLSMLAQRVSLRIAIAIVIAGISYGLIVNASPVIGDNRFFVSLDALRRDSGEGERPGRISSSIAWCNQKLTCGRIETATDWRGQGFRF